MNIPIINDFPMNFVYILIIIITAYILTRYVAHAMNNTARFKDNMTAVYLIRDIICAIIYFIALMIILQYFGINLAGTLLSLGIVGIAVSLAAKDIISNLFSGIILILTRSIKVGDTISINDEKGYIEKISLRSTTIVDDNRVKNNIPNSILTNNEYLLYTAPEKYRVDILTGLPLNIDIVDFRQYIIKKMESYPDIAETPKPDVYGNEISFKQSKIKVSFWVKNFNDKDKYKIIIINDIRKYVEIGEKMSNALQDEIIKLKEEKNAIILAHNYQPKEVQEIADFLGDSLELCIKASEIDDKDLVIFCGVDFMAETAFILNPDKKIVIPNLEAECPMAHMLPEEVLLKAKEEHPDAGVILYVNSIAEAKQHADTLCTSANAVKVTESLPHDKILFGPDKNLGTHVAEKIDKEIIPVPSDGHCYVHRLFHVEDVELKREQYPNAEIICHPECDLKVQKACDKVMSTGGMLRYIASSDKEEFVIGTEIDMITRINSEVPGKKLYPLLEGAICNTMKLHTLEKIRDSLVNEAPEVKLPKDVADKSRKAVEHMLNVSK